MRSSLLGLVLRRRRPPQDEQLADVLDRRGAERVGQLGEQRLAGRAVVGEHAHLDQAVGVSAASISLRTAGVSPSSPISDDRIEVMRFGALFLALGGA